MTTAAFFFDADSTPEIYGRYDTRPKKDLFTCVLAVDELAKGRFKVWSGDLMLHLLAYRTASVDVTASGGRGSRIGTRRNKAAKSSAGLFRQAGVCVHISPAIFAQFAQIAKN